MNKKFFSLFLLLTLCSCQKSAKSEPPITEPIVESEKRPLTIKMDVKEVERNPSEAIVLSYVNDPSNVTMPTKIVFNLLDIRVSMMDKFKSALKSKGFDTNAFEERKDEILQYQSADFRSDLNYVIGNGGGSITIDVDGTTRKFGIYQLAAKTTAAVKYQIDYQDGKKTDSFFIWLPETKSIPAFGVYYFETMEEYSASKDRYYLC